MPPLTDTRHLHIFAQCKTIAEYEALHQSENSLFMSPSWLTNERPVFACCYSYVMSVDTVGKLSSVRSGHWEWWHQWSCDQGLWPGAGTDQLSAQENISVWSQCCERRVIQRDSDERWWNQLFSDSTVWSIIENSSSEVSELVTVQHSSAAAYLETDC